MQDLRITDEHAQPVGLEGDITGVQVLDQLVTLDLEEMMSHGNHVTLGKNCPGDAGTVDECPVSRPQVDDLNPAVADQELGVPPGCEQVPHRDVVTPGPPNRQRSTKQWMDVAAFVRTLKAVRLKKIVGPVGPARRREFRSGPVARGVRLESQQLGVRIPICFADLGGVRANGHDGEFGAGRCAQAQP